MYKIRLYSIMFLFVATSYILAQGSRTISVRLPVSIRSGDILLEPGPYRMELEDTVDGQILVHIRKPDDAKILVSRKAIFQAAEWKAERNAVKVQFRDGSYYLDKLQIGGETNILVFQP